MPNCKIIMIAVIGTFFFFEPQSSNIFVYKIYSFTETASRYTTNFTVT